MDKPHFRLLQTKLYRPNVPKDHIIRPQLLERLEKNQQIPLLLCSAPAGYGKSTLAAHWLDKCDRPNAWVSLDENDNDLRLFVSYFVAAVQTIFPDAGQNTLDLLQASNLPPISVLAVTLINELDQIDQDFILVLDDIHLIHEKSVYDFLNLVLQHPPEPLQLVLIGRRDPLLPIALMRAKALLTEIRMKDLRFSIDESRQFLQKTMAQDIEKSIAESLATKTEGWITGMRLAVLALQGADDPGLKLKEMKGSTTYVLDYLISEVLEQQPEGIRQLLLATSILNRFCGSLCDVITGNDGNIDGHEFINWLQHNNLFLIPLDTDNQWFRYHHLFEDLLRRQLQHSKQQAEIDEIFTRASIWFENQDLIDESIQYALSAENASAAADIVERHRITELDGDRWYVVRRWIDRLPEEVKQNRPNLLLAEAWIYYEKFQISMIPDILKKTASLIDDTSTNMALSGELNFFWGAVNYWEANGRISLDFFEKARPLLPADQQLAGGLLELLSALSRCMINQKEKAIDALKKRIQDAGSFQGILVSRLIAGLFFIYHLSGDLKQARIQAQQMEMVAKKSRIAYTDAWSSYMQASTYLQACDLELSLQHFSIAGEKRYILHRRAAIDALSGLALTCQLMGLSEEAQASMDVLQEFAVELNEPQYLNVAHSCRARLALLRGDLTPAFKWAQSFNERPLSMEMFIWLEVPHITQARVLIAEGSKKNLEHASDLLDTILQLNDKCNFTCQKIEILVLSSIAQEKLGHKTKALTILKEVVILSEPLEWVRPFVESGLPMRELLQKLLKQNICVDYIEKLLVDYKTKNPVINPQPGVIPSKTDIRLRASKISQQIMDPLTSRELDVLELLADRFQNKEIAEKLFISPTTVKSHLKNIYQKLHAENRRHAVKRAIETGLLKQL